MSIKIISTKLVNFDSQGRTVQITAVFGGFFTALNFFFFGRYYTFGYVCFLFGFFFFFFFFFYVCGRSIFWMAWQISTELSHKLEGWTDSNPIKNGNRRFNRLATILEKYCFPAPGSLNQASSSSSLFFFLQVLF